MIYPTILAGGSGTRLWPLSRKSYPKQFATFLDTESLFQTTLRRVDGPAFESPIILTNDEYRFLVQRQMDAIDVASSKILIEPVARNTAPAILSAALTLADTPEAMMLVLPSDHIITDPAAFEAAVSKATKAAQAGRVVCFGVKPTRPETGYGYLELAVQQASDAQEVTEVFGFVEKPIAALAEKMARSSKYLWNAGIFMFRVDCILSLFETHAPEFILPCRAAVKHIKTDLGFLRLESAAYARAENISVDFAVMEKLDRLAVVPCAMGWSDLGCWKSVWTEGEKDDNGNSLSGPVMATACEGSLLRSENSDIQLVGLGLKNIAAIAMGDAVLVADLDDGQAVQAAVADLRAKQVSQADEFAQSHRPWGYYQSLKIGDRFQVKQIVVNPGASLSLQSHVHRAEHWVVVEGSATVTIDDEVKLISENESVYIPLGAVHRLENPGKLPLHLIEVQTGAYLGEDDITRYEDIYERGQVA